jgi:hypothetical protein
MTGLLFFAVSPCDHESRVAVTPAYYYAVLVDRGTAQVFDPDSKIASRPD